MMKKIYKETTLSVYENQDNIVNPTFLKCRINILYILILQIFNQLKYKSSKIVFSPISILLCDIISPASIFLSIYIIVTPAILSPLIIA